MNCTTMQDPVVVDIASSKLVDWNGALYTFSQATSYQTEWC